MFACYVYASKYPDLLFGGIIERWEITNLHNVTLTSILNTSDGTIQAVQLVFIASSEPTKQNLIRK